jgi:hypothetical protein
VRLAICAVIAAATSLSVSAARGEPASPGDAPRADYVAGLLDAIEQTDHTELINASNYIYAVERNKCQAPVESLHVGCLLEAAARNCASRQGEARTRCVRASDVIVTNRLSEKAFVPEDVRYELMDKHKDYRAALEHELDRRYGLVVAEYVMSHHYPGSHASNVQLGAGIESYCRELSGSRALAWQYCVSAVVWFIGNHGATP